MNETEIFVELLEGSATPMFAPVPAVHFGNRFYKIIEHHRADYSDLRFNTGTYVVCLMAKLETKEELVPVAYSEVSKEAVEYILNLKK